MSVTFVKKSGAPAGVIKFNIGSDSYVIDDALATQLVVTNDYVASLLRGSSLLDVLSETPGPFTAPLVRREMTLYVDGTEPAGAVPVRQSDGTFRLAVPSGGSSGGAGIISVASGPGPSDGVDGQYAINTTTGKLIGPKAAGSWASAGQFPFGNAAFTPVALTVTPGTYHTYGAGTATGSKRVFNLGGPYSTTSREPGVQITVDNQSTTSSVALSAYDVMIDYVSGNSAGLRIPRVLDLPSCPPGQPISFQLYGSPVGLRLEIEAKNDIVDPSSYNVGLQAWAI